MIVPIPSKPDAVTRREVHQVAAYLYVTRMNGGGRDLVISNGTERVLCEAADLHDLIALLQRLERENLKANGHHP